LEPGELLNFCYILEVMESRYIRPGMPKERRRPPVWGFLIIVLVVAAIGVGLFALVKWDEKQHQTPEEAAEERARAVRQIPSRTADDKADELVALLMSDVERAINKRSEAGKAYRDQPPPEPSKGTFLADSVRFRQAALNFLRADQELIAHLDGAESRLAEALEKAGIKGEPAETAKRGFKRDPGRRLSILRRVCAAEASFLQASLERLELLENEWGKWRPENNRPIFRSESVMDRYKVLLERESKAAGELDEAQAALAKFQP
jgi:hypothetical protein